MTAGMLWKWARIATVGSTARRVRVYRWCAVNRSEMVKRNLLKSLRRDMHACSQSYSPFTAICTCIYTYIFTNIYLFLFIYMWVRTYLYKWLFFRRMVCYSIPCLAYICPLLLTYWGSHAYVLTYSHLFGYSWNLCYLSTFARAYSWVSYVHLFYSTAWLIFHYRTTLSNKHFGFFMFWRSLATTATDSADCSTERRASFFIRFA